MSRRCRHRDLGAIRAGESAEPAVQTPTVPAPVAPTAGAASTCLAKLIAGGARRRPRLACDLGRGMWDRQSGPAVIDHGRRRRRELAGPAACRLRIRARACRLCPAHRRAAGAGDAACQGRGNRNRPRLYVPDAGPDCRRQDQRSCQGAGGRSHGDHVRRQASGPDRAAGRRGGSSLLPRCADGGLRMVHDRPRPRLRRFHANNMHLDIELHGSSGSYRICQ